MKASVRRRKSKLVPDSRWLAYAAAGAATALTGIPAAEAEIHYSGIVNYRFPGGPAGSNASFPLNNGANLRFSHASIQGEGIARLTIPAPGHFKTFGAFVGSIVRYGGFYLSNLNSRINLSGLRFENSCRYSTSSSTTNCYGGTIGRFSTVHGKFQNRGPGIIGFVFNTGSGLQYGWVRIKTSGDSKYRFIVADYAWGDPGDAILTGQKHNSAQAAAVPKSGSLGLLAVGSAGLSAWRTARVDTPALP